ncbi:MAG: 50S ribosomal protein L11 methyltransferase [Candidatus Binatota bacterium]|nr:50S ribosomal protein L11 methyltransferase [Candidatus Binatota bacterium]
MTESWLHLTVHTSAACLDAVANFLIESGSSGVVLKRRAVEAYFPNNRNAAALKRAVHSFVMEVAKLQGRSSKPRLSWQVARPENWQNSWKRFIRPSRIGKRFWVTPPWLTPPHFRSRQVITIEPGMAFGTGAHATTRGCLEFIEQVAALLPPVKFTALDVGTGSGILAIALAKLGAKRVWALDNDPVALGVARENLHINGTADKVELSETSLSRFKRKFPVVVGNLTAETIVALASALAPRVATGGYLILSGILHDKAAPVLRCFVPRFRVVKRKRAREWVTLLLQRR